VPEALPFLVPQSHTALVIRDGVPEQFLPSGLQALHLGEAKVEVRLLELDVSSLPALAPPDSRALTLPFERSYLHLNGELVGMVKPSHAEPEEAVPEAGPAIKAWEGFNPFHRFQEHYLEALRACLTEPLRACFPSSGICCGGRTASS
jgi:hypothetical protein